MKRTLITLIIFLISQLGFSQDYKSEFQKYCETNDTINQLKTLKKWQSETPKDAELFTSYFNYYFMKSRKEVLALTTDEPEGESLVIKDSLDQNAGFLGSEIFYNPTDIEKGLAKIDEGIKLYPNRLDMRFGKIYALGQIENWDAFTSEILKTIDYSVKNKNNWTWTDHEKYDGNETDFLLSIQNYQFQLYNTGKDSLIKYMREIALKVLEHHPNHVENLSNLSVTYLITGEYDKAIKPLLKAEKIRPKDYIVLGNIAQAYKLKGDKNKAIEYYKKTAEFGNEEAKQFAKQQIIELQE
ncbi:Tetratricopeptide repeat protein [Tenacibaculum sp. 190524A05c]|uniref:tetratricopeptide repeat protein n=1 Tax=Tenacibaculum platacis TaxID=3137852 RepID=UPI0031FB2FBA